MKLLWLQQNSFIDLSTSVYLKKYQQKTKFVSKKYQKPFCFGISSPHIQLNNLVLEGYSVCTTNRENIVGFDLLCVFPKKSSLRLWKIICYRSSHQSCSVKISVLKNFTKFTGKHRCQSLFLLSCNKRLWHKCFPVNFVKFLRTPFLQNTSVG